MLEFETLSGDEVQALLRGEPIVRTENNEPPAAKPATSGKRASVPTTAQGADGLTAAPQATRTITA